MKKVSARAFFALLLAGILLAGTIGFVISYFMNAGKWVTFSGSPHVYTGTNLNSGIVTDRDGTLLLDSTDGRVYSDNVATRTSTMHLLGDRYGYVYAPLLGHFADRMIGYDVVNGLYKLREETATAQLTISADVQNAALQALAGRKGTVGVYNYQTGEILCAVSSPSYDPDNVPDIENDTTGAYNGVYVNRFFDAVYTPGSIYKLLTTEAALETVDDITSQTFTCEGKTIIGGQSIICEGVHGTIDLKSGLAYSCNCVFGSVAVQVGAKTLQKYAEKAGLNGQLECDGNKSAAGKLNLTDAGDGDVAWAGIGQYTDQVTAYAFLRFMGILGGGGEAAEPYLMAAVTSGGHTTYAARTRSTGRIFEAEAVQTLKQMMRNNVTSVYGAWQFPDVAVCAKSGTAEVEGAQPNAMFAGFVADENYPLAFVVFIENAGHGSSVAAPVAGEVLRACIAEMQK